MPAQLGLHSSMSGSLGLDWYCVGIRKLYSNASWLPRRTWRRRGEFIARCPRVVQLTFLSGPSRRIRSTTTSGGIRCRTTLLFLVMHRIFTAPTYTNDLERLWDHHELMMDRFPNCNLSPVDALCIALSLIYGPIIGVYGDSKGSLPTGIPRRYW